ncbi:MAG: hypothetical protein M1834_008554 [Cirrosporium novae-zelandiae]|nr:MAG: hypothetical protein M1834_008554 [Cirrosporium novae-zelandiae]
MTISKNLCLFKETRVDLSPPNPDAVIYIIIPTFSYTSLSPRLKRGNRPEHDNLIAVDESTFAHKYLAARGSIYFRQSNQSPRTILWRVLGDNILELRCIDLFRSGHDGNEAKLVLRFTFPSPIRADGVALADTKAHDLLTVLVLTKNNQLHTLTLRHEFFYRPLASEAEISSWYNAFSPNAFSMAHPHKIHASNSYDVWIALDNGGLLRLTRKPEEHSFLWREATYNDGAWASSLRGLIRWQGNNTIRYDGRSLDQSTATALATSPDGKYVFTVCLNHMLKAWNIESGKVDCGKDLLNKERLPQEALQYRLNPANTHRIRMFNSERAVAGNSYFAVTFSPHEDGQFKFWSIGQPDGGIVHIDDLYPTQTLYPPDPDQSNPLWIVADFDVKAMEQGRLMEMWMLWKYDTNYKIFTLKFDLTKLPEVWEDDWVGCTPEHGTSIPTPVISDTDPEDVTEKWMDYILFPGRYTDAVLETSLAIYRDATQTSQDSQSTKGRSLKDRICSSVASAVTIRRRADSEIDYERFRDDTQVHWQQFWRIAEDLNKRRHEPISMAYDHFADLPWVITADSCCAIRDCSSTEILAHNRPQILIDSQETLRRRHHRQYEDGLLESPEKLSGLVNLAAAFRESFPEELQESCRIALESEVLQEPSFSILTRIQRFYDQCRFAEYVSDDMYDELAKRAGSFGGYGVLSNDLFYQIAETLPLDFVGRETRLRSTEFGVKVLVHGAQETIYMTWRMLFDLLLLAVFVEVEIHQDGGEPIDKFNAPEIFEGFLGYLKQHEVMKWLAKTTRRKTIRPNVSTSMGGTPNRSPSSSSQQIPSPTAPEISLLSDLFAYDVRPLSPVHQPYTSILTYNIRELIAWTIGSKSSPVLSTTFSNSLVYIQCNLLQTQNISLASEFLRFQPSTAWSTYVKGRLYLMRGEYDRATLAFKQAAYVLAHGKAMGELREMSSDLLSLIDVDHFHNGLSKYYQHILTLFESDHAYSYVSIFADLALQFLSSPMSTTASSTERSQNKIDLLSRLFNSALQTQSYTLAYSALSQIPIMALQKSCLTSLITHTVTHNATSELLALPFANEILNHHVDTTLEGLAKKVLDLDAAPEWHRVLASYRIKRGDFRGAAEVIWDRLQRLPVLGGKRRRSVGTKRRIRGNTDQDQNPEEEVLREYRTIINLLSLVSKDQAWIFAEDLPTTTSTSSSSANVTIPQPPTLPLASTQKQNLQPARLREQGPAGSGEITLLGKDLENKTLLRDNKEKERMKLTPGKRRVVALEDLRREYQEELDRVAAVEGGKYEFVGALEDLGLESMDIDESSVGGNGNGIGVGGG